MRTLLVAAFVLAFGASAAMAECGWQQQTAQKDGVDAQSQQSRLPPKS